MLGNDSAPSAEQVGVYLPRVLCVSYLEKDKKFMCIPFTATQGTMVDFMTVSLTLWLGCKQLMIRHSLSSLLMLMFIILSGRSQSLLLIDMGVVFLIFVICQVVSSWCAVRLTLLVKDSIL